MAPQFCLQLNTEFSSRLLLGRRQPGLHQAVAKIDLIQVHLGGIGEAGECTSESAVSTWMISDSVHKSGIWLATNISVDQRLLPKASPGTKYVKE